MTDSALPPPPSIAYFEVTLSKLMAFRKKIFEIGLREAAECARYEKDRPGVEPERSSKLAKTLRRIRHDNVRECNPHPPRPTTSRPKVKVIPANTLEDLFTEAGRRSMMGYTGECIFRNGLRPRIAAPVHDGYAIVKMVEVSKTDRSNKKDNVAVAMEHSNRPQEPAHAKAVREYLLSTACTGEKFILPAFTFNYGVGLDAEAPVATLMLFGASTDGTDRWPGVLLPAAGRDPGHDRWGAPARSARGNSERS